MDEKTLAFLLKLARQGLRRDWDDRFGWFCLWAWELLLAHDDAIRDRQAFLSLALRRKWLDLCKRKNPPRMKRCQYDTDVPDRRGHRTLDDVDTRDLNDTVLAEFPPDHARIMRARYRDGMTIPEAAAACGCGTTKVIRVTDEVCYGRRRTACA